MEKSKPTPMQPVIETLLRDAEAKEEFSRMAAQLTESIVGFGKQVKAFEKQLLAIVRKE